MTDACTLAPDGYFRRGGARWVPTGANWWPASCGVELWQAWPADEIRRDLDLLRGLGLDTLRFFLRWQDFEPEAGSHDRRMLERLDRLLGWCGERGVLAHPTLFVGFMSGGTTWPAWRAGRNVFADPVMRERAVAFTRAATAVIARHRATVCAIDLGNELCCLEDSRSAPPAAVRAWSAEVCAAIRAEWPTAIVIAGNEQGQLLDDTGWRLDELAGCDLLSMHGYPVPGWHGVGFDGMTDPLAQSLLPFYTACARAHAPVMLQEFGTILTTGPRQQESYLRAMLPAAWEAGANGFLWWCLRDITARVRPYATHGFEGALGLVDAQDRLKPGLECFLDFCRGLPQRPAPAPVAGAVGVYWPRHYYPRGNPDNAANQPRPLSRRLVLANHLLRTLGRATRVVRGDLPLPTDLAALAVTGAHLRPDEAETLTEWVIAGGRLIWHGVDPVNAGPAYDRLLGARPVDYRARTALRFAAHGDTWEVAAFPRAMRCEVAADPAEVLARDQDGLPVLTRHRLGRGVVVAAWPQVDDVAADLAEDRAARDRWAGFWAGQLAAAGA